MLEYESTYSYPCALISCKAMSHSSLEAIAAITKLQAQDPFPCKQKRRDPLEAYLMRGTVPLANLVFWMRTTREGLVFRIESMIFTRPV